jgi:hypothetical protein
VVLEFLSFLIKQMPSFENGVWMIETPNCPSCSKIREAQGFPPETATGDICAECRLWIEAEKDVADTINVV